MFLDYNEVANDPIHYQSTYARIVHGERQGPGDGQASLRGNFKIEDIKGRTIHPDGTVIPLTVKPEDLMVSKTGESRIGKKVFSHHAGLDDFGGEIND